jgi:CO/xanthine dehydrogenase Mo-binding subunit
MQKNEYIPFDQLEVPGMLYACMIRATAQIGHILAIRPPALPSGYSILTADQLPLRNELKISSVSIPVFASDTVSYEGETVGLIIGPDPLLVEEFASSTAVECDGDSVHRDWRMFPSSRIAARLNLQRGNMPEVSQNDSLLVFNSYVSIEPGEFSFNSGIGALAEWDYDKLKLACPTLWPEHVRSSLASILEASPSDIELLPVLMNDSSEFYFWYPSLLAARAAFAAWTLKRPVKLIVSIKRERQYLPRVQGISLWFKSIWSSKTSKLLGIECRFSIPTGTYSVFANKILRKTAHLAADIVPGLPVSITGFAIRTNAVPMGAIESPASAAIYAMLQAHIAQAARALDRDVFELSQSTLSRMDTSKKAGAPGIAEIPFAKIAKPLLEKTDFMRKYAAYELVHKRNPGGKEALLRAISFSLAYQGASDFLPESAKKSEVRLSLDRNLKAHVESDAAFASERLKAALTTLIADNLKIPPAHIFFAMQKSPHPDSVPLMSSSGIAMLGDIVRRASARVQRLRFREGLPILAHAFSSVRAQENSTNVLSKIERPSLGAAIIEVEYDTRSGIFQFIRIHISVNAGKILSPLNAKSAIRAASINAMRSCLVSTSPNAAERNDMYDHILSRSTIAIELLDDEKSTIPRPVGDIVHSLVLSCFLGIMQQLNETNRFILPFRPVSATIAEGAQQ